MWVGGGGCKSDGITAESRPVIPSTDTENKNSRSVQRLSVCSLSVSFGSNVILHYNCLEIVGCKVFR